MKYILLFSILLSQSVLSQKLKKSDKAIIENLKTEINYLASDKLEGRRTGTPGEKLAYEYLSSEFGKTGLIPKGEGNTFLQAFDINEGKEILPSTHLKINDTALKAGDDFFPFMFSAEGTAKGGASLSFKEKGMPWFWDIKESLQENKDNPHFDLKEAIKNKAIEYANKGASALIVFNSGNEKDDLKFDGKSKIAPVKIPVVYLTKNASQKYLSDNSADLQIDLHTAFGDKKRTGHNVIGYLDNGAPHTIIIGAHYDHLGYGEDHNSLGTGKPEIHNGADDNASGTAVVLELAKILKNSKLKNNNYLFICFSGEELGLLGSKYFTEHPTVPLEAVNYMMNCDMVGRLNDSTPAITIGGYGTSPEWSKILPQKTQSLNVKFDSSGIGPGDHTSFYLKNIPVLFFFTGMNPDYHKPTDDVDKINFVGELRVIQYIGNILKETNNNEKLVFSKTREPQMGTARFSVSLGFMPDYSYSGSGVRADGIIDGKIAQKIGMKPGDVITRLGDFNVTDINNYMTALSKFKKGDSTKVTVLRGKDELNLDVVF
ncbi:MAG TPA: M20/M25/M40 family metallo-hydrolase [Hanamia sp.]|nr:M20/M25/M40 family metallo-hydrolase [Hanamia sp.]